MSRQFIIWTPLGSVVHNEAGAAQELIASSIVNENFGFTLKGDTGVFTLTGNSAALTYSEFSLVADTGVFVLTGNNADLRVSGGATTSSTFLCF